MADSTPLALTLASQIDEAARRRFEAAWRDGRPQPLEQFLPPADDLSYLPTLAELVQIELELAWKAVAPESSSGPIEFQRPYVETYLKRFPCLQQPPILRRLLTQEYRVRRQQGDTPSFEEYARRFPNAGLDRQELESSAPVATPPQDEVVTVPGYELFGVLGRGGMGVVYKARQVSLNRTVALKMILSGAFATPEQRARFRAEAEAVAQLQHPHVVQIYEVGEAADRPYFSLEFVAGGSLADQLAATPLPPARAAQLVETLARTMHWVHEHGIIHRDLKPANILLTVDGVPKIMDFGLAKRLEGTGGQTQSGDILGTPSYMAPEQASGDSKRIGPAADVYALGAILYECLTGKPPFKAATQLDTLLQVLTEEPVAPARLNQQVARDLDTICLRCLHKEPTRRYASAADLAEDLRRFLAGEPIRARPAGRLERLGRWARRNRALATTGALAGIAVLAALVTLAIAYVLVLRSRDRAVASEAAALQLAHEKDTLAQSEHALREEADQRRQQAARDAARLLYEQTHSLLSLGDNRVGMLWLARTLQEAVRVGDPELEQSVRAQLAAWSQSLQPLRTIFRLESPVPGQEAPRQQVYAVAFRPDGKGVLTGEGDGKARLWDPATGKLLGTSPEHKGPVVAVAFSRDGKAIVTGSRGGTSWVWRPEVERAVGPLRHADPVEAVEFSPDGQTVLIRTGDPRGKERLWADLKGTARLWSATTGEPLSPPLEPLDEVMLAVFSSDGKTVVTGGLLGMVQRWQAGAQWKEVGPLMQGSDAVTALAISPNGKWVAVGAFYESIRLFELETGKPLDSSFGHQAEVLALAFSPDGKTLVSGCRDQTAQVWDVASGKPVGPPLRHRERVVAAAFSPDGQTVVTASHDGTARLWETATGTPLGAPLPHLGRVVAVAFAPDGKSVLTGGDTEPARLWGVERARALGLPLHRLDQVVRVAFRPDGKALLTVSGSGAQEWEAGTGKVLGPVLLHSFLVIAGTYSPDGKTILTGSNDGTGQVWKAGSGEAIGPLLKHGNVVDVVAFSPDSKTALTAGWDGMARLWKADTGAAVGRPLKHSARITAAAFSPDGRAVLAGSVDRTARLWSAATGEPLGPPLPHADYVAVVAFSPEGKRFATGCGDGAVRLWETESGKEVVTSMRHQGPVMALAFRSDGKAILSGSDDRTARLWSAATGEPLGVPLAHDDRVTAVAFSPDGAYLLTGSKDGTARLWEARTGKMLGPQLRHQGPVRDVAFHPRGRAVLTGSEDHTARLWELSAPMDGAPQQVNLWVQVTTGMELDDTGAVRVLDAATWHARRLALEELRASSRPQSGARER